MSFNHGGGVGYANTVATNGIGATCTIIPKANGSAIAGISTRARVSGGTGAASGSGEVNPQHKPDSLGLTTNKPWESANANTAPGTPAAASGTAPSTKPANTGVKTNKPEGLDLTTKAPWKPANSA